MSRRRFLLPRRAAFAVALLGLGFLVLASADGYAGRAASTELTVHEWGTFTVVVGADGIPMRWRPLRATDDLPAFVESRDRNGKTEITGSLRMETPVLYFYSSRDVKVSVEVAFPAGQITEWYPSANVPYGGETITWTDVQVVPDSAASFPRTDAASHYYAARNTDASPLVVKALDGKIQHEKLLFYRGVGSAALPLEATIRAGNVILRTQGRGPANAIVVECKEGRVGFAEVDLPSGSGSTARPRPVDGGATELRAILTSRLEAAGLFPREAIAMIDTWADTWTEDGLRVFYLVPRSATDELLPLRIQPAPEKVERALLGRIEMVTPEMEAKVSTLALQAVGEGESRFEARKALAALGHFNEPIVKIVARRNGDGPVARALHDAVPELFREF